MKTKKDHYVDISLCSLKYVAINLLLLNFFLELSYLRKLILAKYGQIDHLRKLFLANYSQMGHSRKKIPKILQFFRFAKVSSIRFSSFKVKLFQNVYKLGKRLKIQTKIHLSKNLPYFQIYQRLIYICV